MQNQNALYQSVFWNTTIKNITSMSVLKGIREQHKQMPLTKHGTCAGIYYSPCWKFNQGILCTYKQGADISHCEMRFGFYQDSGIFVKKIKNREKSLLVWYSVVFMGREFKKHPKNRETSENSCNCQKHLKRSVRYSSCFHYKGIVVLQKASEMYLAS